MRAFMKPKPLWRAAALLAAACTLHGSAWALKRGAVEGGVPFVSGGVGGEEQAELRAEAARYSLWVVTAERGSGVYLADVQLTLRDAAGRTVLDEALDGPWLMAKVPPGRYTLEARCEGQTLRRSVTIGGKGMQQLHFHFRGNGAHGTHGMSEMHSMHGPDGMHRPHMTAGHC